MERFGWTERELYEENSTERIFKIVEEMSLRSQAEEIRERQERVKAEAKARTARRGGR